MALLAVSALTPLLLITAMTATGRMPVATGAAVLGLIITVDGLLLLWFTRLKLIVQVHSGAVHVAARPAIFPGMVRTIPISQITQCAVQRASTARVGIQWTPGCWHATAGQKHVLVLTLARKRRWQSVSAKGTISTGSFPRVPSRGTSFSVPTRIIRRREDAATIFSRNRARP